MTLLIRYRCPEDGMEYDSRNQPGCSHDSDTWLEVHYIPEPEVVGWQIQVAKMHATLDGVLAGTVVIDETESGDPILLNTTTDPARVVWPEIG